MRYAYYNGTVALAVTLLYNATYIRFRYLYTMRYDIKLLMTVYAALPIAVRVWNFTRCSLDYYFNLKKTFEFLSGGLP